MPNWVTNILRFQNEEDFRAVIDFVRGDIGVDGERNLFDFEKIVPSPSNIFRGALGKKERQECADKGIPNWYDWNIKNWGTKWNSCDVFIENETIRFDTAWATPLPVIAALSENFPNISFYMVYADEDIGQNCGTFTIKNGSVVDEQVLKAGSSRAKAFAKKVKCDV